MAQVFKHQMTISYINPSHILSGSPCSPLPHPAQKSCKDSFLAGYFSNITKTGHHFVQALSFSHLITFKDISWQLVILSHQRVSSSTNYTLTPLKVEYTTKLHQHHLTCLVSLCKTDSSPLKNEYEAIEHSGIKLWPEGTFDTGSWMTFNKLQWYQLMCVATSGYLIHITE